MAKPMISPAARRVLEWLATDYDDEHDGELVCCGLDCWYGFNRTSASVAKKLVWKALVSEEISSGTRVYTINESGRRYLAGLPPYCDGNGNWYDEIEQLIAARRKEGW